MQSWFNLLLIITIIPPLWLATAVVDSWCDRRDARFGCWHRMNSSALDDDEFIVD